MKSLKKVMKVLPAVGLVLIVAGCHGELDNGNLKDTVWSTDCKQGHVREQISFSEDHLTYTQMYYDITNGSNNCLEEDGRLIWTYRYKIEDNVESKVGDLEEVKELNLEVEKMEALAITATGRDLFKHQDICPSYDLTVGKAVSLLDEKGLVVSDCKILAHTGLSTGYYDSSGTLAKLEKGMSIYQIFGFDKIKVNDKKEKKVLYMGNISSGSDGIRQAERRPVVVNLSNPFILRSQQ